MNSKTGHIKRATWLGLILISIIFLVSISSCNKSTNNIPHMYAYKRATIIDYVQNLGFPDFNVDEIRRNSTGTALYFYNFYTGNNTSKIFSVSADGEPVKLNPPAKFAYLNDKNEFVVWFDDIKKGIHFQNGTIRNIIPIFGYFGIDPSGQFFFIGHTSGIEVINNQTVQIGPLQYSTEIASTDHPNTALYSTNIMVGKIFFKDNRIYLFARQYSNFKGLGNYDEHEIICQILKKIGSKFQLEQEIHIPRPKRSPSPFAVVDLDPWSDNVLLVDVKDMPFSFLTSWYLFDLKTRKMTKIGLAKDYGFFLKEDILKKTN